MGNRKKEILIVALHLFARDGYEAVSVSQIAGELGLYEGAWISADSTGIWKNDRSKINIICFFQNQTVGVKWIYPQNPGIAKSN
jgi:hypothetical protein